MAYVASWKAPLGSIMGSQNMEQEPRNAENINETFRKNETEGYFKPPFCQWPFGGTSKKETKQRIKSGEPVVKAGSYEYEPTANDYYFGMGKFTRPKDEDEMSIRTESTTLYMQSNLCTRTFGPNKKPNALPGVVSRPKFEKRPFIKPYIVPDSMKNYDAKIDIFDNVQHDGVRSPMAPKADQEFLPLEKNTAIFISKAGHSEEMKPAVGNPYGPEFSPPQPLRSGKRGLPRSYAVGAVPRVSDSMPAEKEPVWRQNDSRVLISPRTYLNATEKVTKKNKYLEDRLFEPNGDLVLTYEN
ncbi:unnamed protein product [Amoebophrya sp. A120]|nr:unnamed protein product [Amoebophrya sp. A120]|eukprot:GSA120T00013004001.1